MAASFWPKSPFNFARSRMQIHDHIRQVSHPLSLHTVSRFKWYASRPNDTSEGKWFVPDIDDHPQIPHSSLSHDGSDHPSSTCPFAPFAPTTLTDMFMSAFGIDKPDTCQ
jgi:hypothetical protein